jgi:hypothetical protein
MLLVAAKKSESSGTDGTGPSKDGKCEIKSAVAWSVVHRHVFCAWASHNSIWLFECKLAILRDLLAGKRLSVILDYANSLKLFEVVLCSSFGSLECLLIQLSQSCVKWFNDIFPDIISVHCGDVWGHDLDALEFLLLALIYHQHVLWKQPYVILLSLLDFDQ